MTNVVKVSLILTGIFITLVVRAEPSETHFQLNYKYLEIPLLYKNQDAADLQLKKTGLAYGERFAKNWYSEIQAGYSKSSLTLPDQVVSDAKGKYADLSFQYALYQTKYTFVALGINYVYNQFDQNNKNYRLNWSETGGQFAIAQRIFSPVTLTAGLSYINIDGTQKYANQGNRRKFNQDGDLRYEAGIHFSNYEDGEIIFRYFTDGQDGFEVALKKVYR